MGANQLGLLGTGYAAGASISTASLFKPALASIGTRASAIVSASTICSVGASTSINAGSML